MSDIPVSQQLFGHCCDTSGAPLLSNRRTIFLACRRDKALTIKNRRIMMLYHMWEYYCSNTILKILPLINNTD